MFLGPNQIRLISEGSCDTEDGQLKMLNLLQKHKLYWPSFIILV